MNALANPLVTASAKGAAWLLAWSWQAAILLACVWAGLKIFRVKSPALRHQVWLFALIAVAATPILSGVARNLPLPQSKNRPLSYVVELPQTVVATGAEPVVQNAPAPFSVKPSTKRPFITGALFVAWVIGACVTFARAVMNGARQRRLRINARHASLADLDCAECETLQNARVSIALSEKIRSPILLGVFRPVIGLPADIVSWTSPAERCAILQHEQAHVERRDHYVNLFQIVIGVIFFFHPLARYACRQLSMEREFACDDRVINLGAAAQTYAESIVKVAERSVRQTWAVNVGPRPSFFSARQILERRIEMILNTDRGPVIGYNWRYLLPPAAMIACLTWLLIPGRMTKTNQFQYRENNMSDNTQFEYPSGSDEEILKALVQKLAETIPRHDYSMSQYLSPKDCQEIERFGKPLSETIKEFYERGNTITKIDIVDFMASINPLDNSATVNFQTTINLLPQGDAKEINVFRRYAAGFKKVNGKWRPSRDRGPLPPEFRDTALSWLLPPPPPPPPPLPSVITGAQTGQRSDEFQNDREAIHALLRELADATLRRDTSVFERILTDDYIGMSPDSLNSLNKAQQIAAIESHGLSAERFEFKGLDVYFQGNGQTAVATFTGKAMFQTGDQSPPAEINHYITLDKLPEQWKVSAIFIIHVSRPGETADFTFEKNN